MEVKCADRAMVGIKGGHEEGTFPCPGPHTTIPIARVKEDSRGKEEKHKKT